MSRLTAADPQLWSAVDRCLLWLGLMLGLFGFYLYRADYLLVHPSVEPYFDRHALGVFHRGLVAVTSVSALLFLICLALRRRTLECRWISHAANQVWWVWTSICAYALGPVTTPILGLVLFGGFVSMLLFPRRVVLPAMACGMSILVVTTVAERADLLPYAPLFGAPPEIDGRLATPYVVGTSAIAFALIVSSLVLVSYLVELGRARERDLLAAGREREQAWTELQQALESLRETEERFRQLAENAREIFWLIDVETGGLLYVSPNFEPMWGMSSAQLHERPERFLERIHPDDRARVTDHMTGLRARIAAGDGGGDLEYRFVRPEGGEARWLHVRAFPIRNPEGRVYRIGGLIEDITERRSAEAALIGARQELEERIAERTAELTHANEHLREEAAERRRAQAALAESEERLREQFTELEHLYQNAPIGLCFHDTEMRYVRINERLAAINGKPVAAHIGRTLGEIVPQIAPTVGPIMRGVLDTGVPALDIQVVGTTPAEPATERCWLTSYYPVKSPDGRVLGVSAVVQDISELRWAEERARRHLETLAHVSRVSTMGLMATGIAHELNQPLAAITNYAFLGRQKASANEMDAADGRKAFDDILGQALRAGGIVHHLRAFVNKAHPDRVATSVTALISDVLTLVGSELRANGIQPVIELDEALPEIRADSIQVQQVILNLIRNSIEAMAEVAPLKRSLRVTATLRGGLLEVGVRDAGKGLTDVDRVFDAFYTTKSEGMGMGLAISRSIIEDHGGRLWAQAHPGGGATFRFALPVVDGDGHTAT